MKKLFTEDKWKRHSLARMRAQLKAAHRRHAYLAEKAGHPHIRQRTARPFKHTSSIQAPAVFSLIRNPDGMISFLKQIHAVAGTRNVFVDLSGVTDLTPDAVAVLLATIHHRNVGRARIMGNVPADPGLRSVLNDSGFGDYVTQSTGPLFRSVMGRIRRRSRSTETHDDVVKGTVAKDLIEFATNKLYGQPRPHQPSYRVLGEAMLNTFNHASAGDEREPWWVSVFYDDKRQCACFTIIDQGIGIFKSHRLGLRLQLAKGLRFTNNAEILRELFRGKIPSSTKVAGRGYGIPGMYRHCKAGRIKNLTILSNDAMGNAGTEVYSPLKTQFDGTVIYWEVDADSGKGRAECR